MDTAILDLVFHGDLKELLRIPHENGAVSYSLGRRASLKDVIESLAIPHTEIWRVLHAGKIVELTAIACASARYDIFPFLSADRQTLQSALDATYPEGLRFLVDSTALKLARCLRLLGLDVETVDHMDCREIARRATAEHRILLTRNRELLQLKQLSCGRLLRSEDYQAQLQEVTTCFPSSRQTRLFSRCMQCNGVLQRVDKASILHLLEPLTIQYYDEFRQCPKCAKVYWKGSHYEKMVKFVETLFPRSNKNR